MPRWRAFEPYFWSLVDRSRGPSACWEWLSGKYRFGYGKVWFRGRRWAAHRVAWTLVKGEIEPGKFVCHHCDHPPCVNPQHLFVGSQFDNMRDCARKGRNGVWTHPESLLRGCEHPGAKLDESDVKKIRVLAQQGQSKAELGRDFGVTDVLVGLIVRGKAWKHVT